MLLHFLKGQSTQLHCLPYCNKPDLMEIRDPTQMIPGIQVLYQSRKKNNFIVSEHFGDKSFFHFQCVKKVEKSHKLLQARLSYTLSNLKIFSLNSTIVNIPLFLLKLPNISKQELSQMKKKPTPHCCSQWRLQTLCSDKFKIF